MRHLHIIHVPAPISPYIYGQDRYYLVNDDGSREAVTVTITQEKD